MRVDKIDEILQGFGDEDDTFDYELEASEQARAEFRAGKGIPIEDVRAELAAESEET